ncbi:MAG: murein biosynthesis integral membrane protein MurJ [Candidatus Portnoybacteria bacterium]|nr:murein biosynthesis integral membrane protein MurJ [Candidatus Portnoybacteria bacterium]
MRGFFRSNQVLASAILIGIGGLLSRLLGLYRDRLLASSFGASRELDIYYAAFRIPDFIYGVLILGAVSAAFIPVFASLSTKEERDAFVSSSLTSILLFMGGICVLLFIFAPYLIALLAPGFSEAEKNTTILLTRIMLLQPVFLAASSVAASVLQSMHHFLATALAPSFYNLGIIIGVIVFVPSFGLVGLAYGVVIGSLLHLLIQLPPLLALGISIKPLVSLTKEVKKMLSLMGPRVLGIISDQVNLLVVTAIASLLALGSIAIFNLAQNIQAAPVGIIGIAIATAAFPTLTKSFNQNAKEEFSHTFLASFRLVLFFGIPLSILFILLRAQIVRVVLGAGLFDWQDTRLTAASLGIFGLSVFAQSIIPLLTRAFYSMHDTKTPVTVGVVSAAVNIGLALALLPMLASPLPFYQYITQILKLEGIPDIRVLALPLSFSLTMIGEFILLTLLLFSRIDGEHMAALNTSWLKMVVSASLMALITYISLRPLANMVDMTTGIGVFLQGLGAGVIGIAVYFGITYLLNENPLTIKRI